MWGFMVGGGPHVRTWVGVWFVFFFFNLKGDWESPFPLDVGGPCEKERGVSLRILGDGPPGFSEDIFRIINSRVGARV